MKKILTLVSIAAVVCACNKNEMAPIATGYGHIEISGISNDETVATKAVQTVEDFSSWTVKVGDVAYTGSTQKFTAGTYTVTASNYADEATANAADSGWGAAFYTGSKGDVQVVAGATTNVEIACGTAKNARLAVVFNTATFGTFITEYSVNVAKAGVDDGLVFNGENAATKKAYFAAGTADVAYTIAYKYNGAPKAANGTITLGAAATEKKITISANNNGTITVTITYDDTFGDGGEETFDIDAATGEQVVSE